MKHGDHIVPEGDHLPTVILYDHRRTGVLPEHHLARDEGRSRSLCAEEACRLDHLFVCRRRGDPDRRRGVQGPEHPVARPASPSATTCSSRALLRLSAPSATSTSLWTTVASCALAMPRGKARSQNMLEISHQARHLTPGLPVPPAVAANHLWKPIRPSRV